MILGEADGALYRPRVALGRQVDQRPLMGTIKASIRRFHLRVAETKGQEKMGWRCCFRLASWSEEALPGEACSGAVAGVRPAVAACS
jgi:hypothetical protein